MEQKQIERNALIITTIINTIITCSGIFIYIITDLQALFLDSFFSLIALISTISAIVISKTSAKKTKYYPQGLYFLEPLYAIIKSILTIILMIIALISVSKTAYMYFSYGIGEMMNSEPLLPYSIIMAVLCIMLSFYNRTQNKKINNTSIILEAESKTNFIDGLQSVGIGLGIILLKTIPVESSLGFLYYTGDFFITTILVITSIKEPISILISAFLELTSGVTKDKNINKTIDHCLRIHFKNIPKYYIFKKGMKINVNIYINNTIAELSHKDLNSVRDKMIKDLSMSYEHIEIAFII